MTAGNRDSLVTFQRAPVVDDGYTERRDWDNPVTLGTEWADVNYGRGDERRQAAMEQGEQPATFNVLDNSTTRGVRLNDRILFGDEAWDITSNVPGKLRGERDITATRAA